MISITDIFKLIPDSLKQTAVDAIVETVVERGEGLLSESILGKIKGLRSDAAFRRQFDAGLQRGLQRFVDEYQLQDEDLVAAIAADDTLFAQPQVQQALLTILQQPGHYLAAEQNALSQSFANVLPQRLNRERVNRAVAFLLKCLARELWHLPELQPIYSLEFQRITAESTREQLAVQKAQLAALENLNVGVRDALLQLTDALGEQKQLAAGQSGGALPTPQPAVYHNLPQPDYGEFVGREKEMKRIFDLLRPYPQSRHHLIVIDGIGGIGKSTLALEVAYRCLHASLQAARAEQPEQDHLVRLRQMLIDRFSEDELRTLCFDMALDYDMLPGKGKGGKARELVAYLDRRNRLAELLGLIRQARPDIRRDDLLSFTLPRSTEAEQFDAIIWASAKKKVLTPGGIITRTQVLNAIEDIYSTIAFTLQREDITRAHSAKHQNDLVKRALTRQRTLLIIDNLETLTEKSVLSFLRELPHPTKAIITTRHSIDVAYTIRLVGMPWEDAIALIQQECQKKSINELSNAEQKNLYKLTGGVPLAIVWSIAKIARGLSINSVLNRLHNRKGDITRFCFSESLLSIQNTPAYRLLVGLSVFNQDASDQALLFVTGLSEFECDSGIEDLITLSLVNRHYDRLSMLPLTRNLANLELSQDPGLEEQLYLKATTYYVRFLKERRQDRENVIYEVIREKQNILGMMEWSFQNDQGLFTDLAGDMDYYFSISGDWINRGKYLHLGIDTADKLDRHQDKARLLRLLAGLNQFQGNYELALKHADESHAINSWLGNQLELALVHNRYAATYRELKDFTSAYQHVNKAIELAEELDKSSLINRINTLFASIEVNQGNYEKADEYMQLVQERPGKMNWRTTWQSRLAGQIAFGLGKYKEAEQFLLDALKQAQSIGNPNPSTNTKKGNLQNIAEAKYHLAILYFELNDRVRGMDYARSALELFSSIGMNKRISKVRELIQNNILPDSGSE